jgi:hypothetical protein
MTVWLTHQEQVDKFTQYLHWEMGQSPNVDEDLVEEDRTESDVEFDSEILPAHALGRATIELLKHPSFPKTSISDLEKYHHAGCFQVALREFLAESVLTCQITLSLYDHFDIFKHFKLHLLADITGEDRSIHDIICATPEARNPKGHPQHFTPQSQAYFDTAIF